MWGSKPLTRNDPLQRYNNHFNTQENKEKCNMMPFQPLLRTSFHPYYRLTSVPIGMEPRPYRDAKTTF